MTAIDVYPDSPSAGVVTDSKVVERLMDQVLTPMAGGTGFGISGSVIKPRQRWSGDCSVYEIESLLQENSTVGIPYIDFVSGSFRLETKVLSRIREKNYQIFDSVPLARGNVGIAVTPVEIVKINAQGLPARKAVEPKVHVETNRELNRTLTDESDVDHALSASLAWWDFVQEAMKKSRPMDRWERKVAADFLWSEFE